MSLTQNAETGSPGFIERLSRSSYGVFAFIGLYFAVNVIVRLLQPAALETDEGQQLFLTQWFAAGYDTQPPFYTWLQYLVVQLFGPTVFSLSLLKNLTLFLSYVFYGLAASLLIRNKLLAAIVTLALITIPQISFEMQRDLTHTVGALFCACMFLYFFLLALKNPTAWAYAMTGVAVALGVQSKYNFIFLPLAAVIAVLADRDFRARLLDWRVLLTAAVAIALVTPHTLWFFSHIDEATHSTLQKMGKYSGGSRLGDFVTGIVELAKALASAMAATLAIFWVAFGKRLLEAWRAETQWTRLIGRMMIVFVVLLFCLVLFGVSQIKGRWVAPYFFLLPLYLGLKLEAAADAGVDWRVAGRRFGWIVLAFMIVVPTVLYGRLIVGGWMGAYKKQNVPYGPAVSEILAAGPQRPVLVLAADQQLAGNIRLEARDIPVVVPGYENLAPTQAFDAAHPLLVIWRHRGEPTPTVYGELTDWLNAQSQFAGQTLEVKDAGLPYHYGRVGDLYHFSYAWLYPKPAAN